MVKLEPGTLVWITKADGGRCKAGWAVDEAFYVEWDGEAFLGCGAPRNATPVRRGRYAWFPKVLLMRLPFRRISDADCMVEQLAAEGLL